MRHCMYLEYRVSYIDSELIHDHSHICCVCIPIIQDTTADSACNSHTPGHVHALCNH